MIYFKLFWEFLLIGSFTFGGGYAMLPLIQQVVLENQWLLEEQILDFIAVSESTPGPLAVNMATYVGFRTAGFLGSFLATLGVVFPSFCIILIVSRFYIKFRDNKIVKSAMAGLQPAVIALITTVLVSVFINTFDCINIFNNQNLGQFFILLVTGFLCLKKKHPIVIICTSAIMGIVVGYVI